MAITLNSGRQEVIAARVVVTLGTGNDVDAIGTYPAVQLPANAVVVGGNISVSDATTATVDFNLGDADDADRYAAAVDGGAVGSALLTVTGTKYDVPTVLNLGVATAAPADEGQVEITVLYVVEGRAAFSEG